MPPPEILLWSILCKDDLICYDPAGQILSTHKVLYSLHQLGTEQGATLDYTVQFTLLEGLQGLIYTIDGDNEHIKAWIQTHFFQGLNGPQGHIVVMRVDKIGRAHV